jgi:glycosidase
MNESIQLLIEKKHALYQERQRIIAEYDERLDALQKAIELLDGNPGKYRGQELDLTAYDDQSPTYIKGNEDGI